MQGYFGARRGQQHNGLEGKDVVGLPGIHIEVKRNERVQLSHYNQKYPGAVQQACRDADPGELPVVAHRKNKDSQWLVTMRAEDFLTLYEHIGNPEELKKTLQRGKNERDRCKDQGTGAANQGSN